MRLEQPVSRAARSPRQKWGWLKLALVLGMIALSVSSPLGCGCVGGLTAVGLDTLKAIESQDADRVASHFIEEIREEAAFSFEVVFALLDEIRIFNVEGQVLSETENTATVEVGIDWEATGLGMTRSGHVVEPIDLERVDGEWLIIDFAPFEWLLDEISEFEG